MNVAAYGYDGVAGRGIACVADGVKGSWGDEDDSAGADVVGLAVVLKVDGALEDGDDLGVLDAVGWIGRGAWLNEGFVNGDGLSSGEGAAEDIAAFGSVGHGARGHGIVGEDLGVGEVGALVEWCLREQGVCNEEGEEQWKGCKFHAAMLDGEEWGSRIGA